MNTQFTPAERAVLLKVAVSLRDDFRQRTSEYSYRCPVAEDLRPAFEKKHKVAELKAAVEKAKAPLDAAQKRYDKAADLFETATMEVQREMTATKRDRLADMERQFAVAVVRIAAAADAAEAQKAIEDLF